MQLPLEVNDLVVRHAGRRPVQALSHAHYRLCNRRPVEFVPAVRRPAGRIEWRASVLAGPGDWLSAPCAETEDSARLLRMAAVAVESDAAFLSGPDAPAVLGVLVALGRTAVLDFEACTAAPLALPRGLRSVSVTWTWPDPPRVGALPPGLQELRLDCADLRGLALPPTLRLLELSDPVCWSVRHIAAQLARTPDLERLFLAVPMTHLVELRAVVEATRALPRLRSFGLQSAPVVWSPGALEALAGLAGMRALELRQCALTTLEPLSLAGVRDLDVAYNPQLGPGLVGRDLSALLRIDVSGVRPTPVAELAAAAPALVEMVAQEARLTPGGWLALSTHPALRRLDLCDTCVPVAVVTLVGALRGLEWLALNDALDDCRCPAADAPPHGPARLRTLFLRYHRRLPVGLERLLPELPTLEHLEVSLDHAPDPAVWAAIGRSSVRRLVVHGTPGALPSAGDVRVTFAARRPAFDLSLIL
jgi:hypothetical protein